VKRYIAYYRVSTKRQGESGLGLDAQRRSVADFVRARGAELLDEFIEVESGANDARPQLTAALAAAKLYQVPLIIAKLDRLSRSAAFLMQLQESGAEFICADMPDVCDMTIGVMALMARQEREAISKRTKAALREAKGRGTALGGLRANHKPLTPEARDKGVRVCRESAARRAERYREVIVQAVVDGADNPTAVARVMNEREVPSPYGHVGKWQGVQVARILDKLDLTVRQIIKECV
jgi:DNA invertase Pin-like site-specific DNA recombinase